MEPQMTPNQKLGLDCLKKANRMLEKAIKDLPYYEAVEVYTSVALSLLTMNFANIETTIHSLPPDQRDPAWLELSRLKTTSVEMIMHGPSEEKAQKIIVPKR